ncbi:MAG: substrate-binding domain-containing protein [Candidatus Thiodiazotropha sp.]
MQMIKRVTSFEITAAERALPGVSALIGRELSLLLQRMFRLAMLLCLFTIGESQSLELERAPATQTMAGMERVVSKASQRVSQWDGPVSGPAGKAGMSVAVICEDLRNGGVLGVARGIGEAADVMGWRIRLFDAHGTRVGRTSSLEAAFDMQPDGVILLGSDADSLEPGLSSFAKREIPLVGWHVGPEAGKLTAGSVAMNVSTDPMEVARVTAMAAIVESQGKAGVVIFRDDNFAIAMRKAKVMQQVIQACQGCQLLEMRTVAISQSAELMPSETRELLIKYGDRWTHALAINDIYFDYAAPELTKAGRVVHLYSAGDGSPSAFLRIQAGTFQYGTVAEPLNLQGWQLVDELNRLLSGWEVSGYVMPVHLVTPDNIGFDGGPRMLFDPDNGYREVYRRIWKR